MKILVFSDSHGHPEPMLWAITDEKPDLILFLGDGLRDCREVYGCFPQIPVRQVMGNCDFGAAELIRDEFVCQDRRIVMAHGHTYNVKLGYSSIINMACCAGADILLFGHTHRRYYAEENGLLVINPGSIGYSRDYGVLELRQGRAEYFERNTDRQAL